MMEKEARLKIDGMYCNSCSALIELTLQDKSGVKSINVDHQKGEGVLVYDSEIITLDDVSSEISELGYSMTQES